MSSRAQAALEFLTTYGWAFLVVLVMIGALAYFGIFNPADRVPERCLFSSGFDCRDFAVVKAGGNVQLLFILKNGLGSPLTMTNVSLPLQNGTIVVCAVAGGVLDPDATANITCPLGNVVAGPPLSFEPAITYRLIGGMYDRVAQGSLAVRVPPSLASEDEQGGPIIIGPPIQVPVCGNKVLETGETCEPEVAECVSGFTCSDSCACVANAPTCGNSVCENGENPDSCPDDCPVIGGTFCGNRRLDPGEACELGTGYNDCGDYTCTWSCTCDLSVQTCGNRALDPGESCDASAGYDCAAGYSCKSCMCVQ